MSRSSHIFDVKRVVVFTALVATIVSSAIVFTSPTASAAPTESECRQKFGLKENIKVSDMPFADQQDLNSCRASGFCKLEAPNNGDAQGGYSNITCTKVSDNEALKEGQSKANQLIAKTIHEQPGICGPAPTGGSERVMEIYLECGKKADAAYSKCEMTGGSATSTQRDTPANISECLKRTYPDLDVAKLTAALDAAFKGTDAIIDKAIKDNLRNECTSAGREFDDATNSCAEKKDDSGDTTETTCAINGVGWIVCPVVSFLANIADMAHGAINKIMTVNTVEIFQTSGPAYTAWKAILVYANIAFIIAFLVIIYSQITSTGISNYGIKKLLPRLILVALLTNTSFWICGLAVEVSNVAGVSLTNLIASTGGAMVDLESDGVLSGQSTFFSTLGALIVVGVAGVVAWFAVGMVLSMLIFVVVAGITVYFVISLRQALIILLVVISPLAFVAYLLPNTEGLFKKWWGLFKTLLLVFPIIGVLYGAGKLSSKVLMATDDGIEMKIIAGFLLFAPLMMTYIILKKVLDAFGPLGQMVGNLQNKGYGAANKKAQERYADAWGNQRKQNAATNKALVRSGNYKGKNPIKKGFSKAYGGINKHTGQFGHNMAAAGIAIAGAQEQKDVDSRAALISSGATPGREVDHAQDALKNAIKNGDRVGIKGATKVLAGYGGAGTEAIHDTLKTQDNNGAFDTSTKSGKANAESVSSALGAIDGLKGRDKSLDEFSGSIGTKKLEDIRKDGGYVSGLNDVELAGQTKEHLNDLVKNSNISSQRAQQILDNPTLGLSTEKRKIFEDIVSGATGPSGAPSAPSGGSGSGGSSGGGSGSGGSSGGSAPSAPSGGSGSSGSSGGSAPSAPSGGSGSGSTP